MLTKQETKTMSYFETIYPIWAAYFAKKISLTKRDELLSYYRANIANY